MEQTKLYIPNTLYSVRFKRNLLSFRDIRRNRYHIETLNKNNAKYLCLTKNIIGRKCILDKLPTSSSGLYYAITNSSESYTVMNKKFIGPKMFMLYYDCLGHPVSTIIRIIIENSYKI